jgi:fructose-1-phosphate kinase PfkB-like protein
LATHQSAPDIGGSARLVLDIRGPELLECLPHRPLLVKPNREELAATIGRPLSTDAELVSAMREVNAAGAEWVLVTQGPDAAWLTSTSETWRVEPPGGVRNINPIGCGDCVAAGVAFGVFQQLWMADCVRLGMAAAAANLEQMKSARFAANRVKELFAETNCARI